MKVLFIGGTGLISSACTRLAVKRGVELFLLNRGSDPDRARGATSLVADLRDEAAAERALARYRFDAVVDWVAFTPDDVERDLRLYRDRTDQFVFISSASAYLKPLGHWLLREDSPLANPFWDYSRNKIACEERLLRAYREDGFPVTIVRPSLTYGDTQVPLAMNSWERPFTAIARMRQGKPLIVPGDGTSPVAGHDERLPLAHPRDRREGPFPAVHGQWDLRVAVGERRADDRDREPVLAVCAQQALLAGDLVARVVPERVRERRILAQQPVTQRLQVRAR